MLMYSHGVVVIGMDCWYRGLQFEPESRHVFFQHKNVKRAWNLHNGSKNEKNLTKNIFRIDKIVDDNKKSLNWATVKQINNVLSWLGDK